MPLNQFKGDPRCRVSRTGAASWSPIGAWSIRNEGESYWGQPLLWRDWVLAPSMSGNLTALRLPTSRETTLAPRTALTMKGAIYSSAVFVDRDRFLIGSDGGDLLLCRPSEVESESEGKNLRLDVEASLQLPGAVHGNPVLAPEAGTALVPCYDGRMYLVRYEDGLEIVGSVKLSEGIADDVYSTPVCLGPDSYAVGTGDDIVFFGASGVQRRIPTGGEVDSSPGLSGETGQIGFGSCDGRFRVFDTVSRAQVFEFDAGSAIRTSIGVRGAQMMFGTAAGKVFLYDAIMGTIREEILEASVAGAAYTKSRPNSFFFQSFSATEEGFLFLDGIGRLNHIDSRTGEAKAFLAGGGLHATPLRAGKVIVSGGHFGDLVIVHAEAL